MTRTRKAIAAVLGMLCAVCMAMLVLSACGPAEQAELKSIKITTPPTTVEYLVGDEFDPAGMVVTATYSDETSKEVTGWTFDEPTMTLAEGRFEANVSVKVSYTEGEVTKTANQTIKIHNYIESATIETYPKQEYFIGQTFDIKGMEINATLEDGTQKVIAVTASNAKWEPTEGLGSDVNEVVVTIGGYEIKVPVSTLNAIYVEGETGYRNGALIEQSTGDSGNIRVDATTDKAQAGAENLFKAKLRAAFALEQIKSAEGYDEAALALPSETVGVTVGGEVVTREYDAIVAWLADENNAAAIKEYEESEEFAAAVEEYLASEQFVEDYSHYVAHDSGTGENYLGQNNQGHVLSFVFDSSAAATGSIAFRLASSYLYRDSNWKPSIMGDMQFNKLCEFYVNGVKYDIADDVLLEGGMTADGSAEQILWCNWKEVQFSDVAFVEGRNVIELRFLYHGVIGSQSGYNFAANVDTLLVAPAEGSSAQLDTYDNTNVKVESTISAVKIEGTTLTIEGALSGTSKGYFGDILDVRVGNSYANLTLNGTNFVATAEVGNFRLGEYAITVAGSALEKDNATIDTAGKQVGNNTYALVVSDAGIVTLSITSDKTVTLTDVVTGTAGTIKVEVRGEGENAGVYYVIGGTFTYESTGYSQEELAAAIAAELKLAIYFDLQGNPYMETGMWNGDWATYLTNAFEVTVTLGETNTYEIAINITSLGNYSYTTHCDNDFHPNMNGEERNHDFKPDIDSFTNEVEFNGRLYTVSYTKGGGNEEYYGCVGLKIKDYNPTAPETTINPAMTLVQEGNKVYVVVTGTYKNMTEAEVKAAYAFDAEVGQGDTIGTVTTFTEEAGNISWAFDAATGTFTVKLDVTDLAAVGPFWMHYATGKDLTCTANAEAAITVGGKTYVFRNAVFTWGNRDLFCIDAAA